MQSNERAERDATTIEWVAGIDTDAGMTTADRCVLPDYPEVVEEGSAPVGQPASILVERTVRHDNGSIDYVTDIPGGERIVTGSLVAYGSGQYVTGVARWYNHTTRDWVVMLVDAEGNQVGSSEYMYSKDDAVTTVLNWAMEALTMPLRLSDRRSAGEVSTPATEQRPAEGQEGAQQMSPEEQTNDRGQTYQQAVDQFLAGAFGPEVKAEDVAALVRTDGVEVWTFGYGDSWLDEDGYTTLDESDLWAFDGKDADADVVASWAPFTVDGDPVAIDHVLHHMDESDPSCSICQSTYDEEQAGSIPDNETLVTFGVPFRDGTTTFSVETESPARRDALVAFLLQAGVIGIETTEDLCADCGEGAEAHGMWSSDLSHTFS